MTPTSKTPPVRQPHHEHRSPHPHVSQPLARLLAAVHAHVSACHVSDRPRLRVSGPLHALDSVHARAQNTRWPAAEAGQAAGLRCALSLSLSHARTSAREQHSREARGAAAGPQQLET